MRFSNRAYTTIGICMLKFRLKMHNTKYAAKLLKQELGKSDITAQKSTDGSS